MTQEDTIELASCGIEKFHRIKTKMNEYFLERGRLIHMVMLGMIGQFNVVVIGDVGLAKTMIAESWYRAINNSTFFIKLMNKNLPYDELFGPVDVEQYLKGVYTRKIEGYLPTCHYVALDEGFKANEIQINPTLRCVNEKKFTNGNVEVDVPLRSLLVASNEKPKTAALDAFWSRMLGRVEVHPISENSSFMEMLSRDGSRPDYADVGLTLQEVDAISSMAKLVDVPEEIGHALWQIRGKLKTEGVGSLDDRKAVWLVNKLLRVEALMSGQGSVTLDHLSVLSDSIWENLGEQAAITKILAEVCGHSDEKGLEVIKQAKEIFDYTEAKFKDVGKSDPAAFAEIAKDCTNSLNELRTKTESEQNTAIGRKKALIGERKDKITIMIDKINGMLAGGK
jgi:MoxR-like ATPase